MESKIYRHYINLRVNIKYYLFQQFKANAVGHEFINHNITEIQYQELLQKLYGNQYLSEKYENNYEERMEGKREFAKLVSNILNPENIPMKICDAGANKGYQMKAFLELGIYEVYGFDILDDKNLIIESPNDIVRKNYMLGSILNIPKFDVEFDIVISTDVFEHIPLNKIDTMVEQLLKLQPRYFIFQISRDVFNDGHITLKGTRFWISKFKGYRVMKELKPLLRKKAPMYEYSGVPRNGWNKCPGLIFLERKTKNLEEKKGI